MKRLPKDKSVKNKKKPGLYACTYERDNCSECGSVLVLVDRQEYQHCANPRCADHKKTRVRVPYVPNKNLRFLGGDEGALEVLKFSDINSIEQKVRAGYGKTKEEPLPPGDYALKVKTVRATPKEVHTTMQVEESPQNFATVAKSATVASTDAWADPSIEGVRWEARWETEIGYFVSWEDTCICLCVEDAERAIQLAELMNTMKVKYLEA